MPTKEPSIKNESTKRQQVEKASPSNEGLFTRFNVPTPPPPPPPPPKDKNP